MGVDLKGCFRPVDIVVVMFKVQALWDLTMFQTQNQGDQAHHSGGGEGVAEIGFGGGQGTGLSARVVRVIKGLGQSVDLHRITQAGNRCHGK